MTRHWPLLLIVATVLVANALPLLGLVDTDPLVTRSGITVITRAQLLAGTNSIDPNDGYTSLALEHLAAQDWVHGHLPLWNPFEGVGSPLLAEMQSAAAFPLIFLTLLPQGLLLQHLVLELIAGLATYALLRQLGLSRGTACAGGVAFALNGTFSWLGNAVVNPVAFLPLALLGVERIVAGARAGRTILVAALLLSLLAGFPEVALLDGVLVAVWALVRLGSGAVSARTAAAHIAISGVLAALLSAPVLVPFARYLGIADTGGHTDGGYGHVHVALRGLASIGAPYLAGPIFASTDANTSLVWDNIGGYVGASVVLLAAVGTAGRRCPRRLRVALAVFAVVALLRTFGFGPVESVLAAVPGLASVAAYRYDAAAYEFALLVLACYGVAELAETARVSRRRAAIGIAAGTSFLVVTVAGCAAALLGSTNARPVLPPIVGSVVVVTVIVGALTFGLARRTALLPGLALTLLAAEAVGSFVVPQLSAPRQAHVDEAVVAATRAQLGGQRLYTLSALQPNFGSQLDLRQINVNDVPVPNAWKAIAQSLLPGGDPTLLVGTPRSGANPDRSLIEHEAAYRDAGVSLVMAPAGARLPADAVTVYRDHSLMLARLPGARPPLSVLSGGPCTLTGSQTLLRAACGAPALLRVNSLRLPGWSATLDGRSTGLGTSLYDEIAVPGGTHEVALHYVAPGLGVGLVLGGIGLLGACLVAVAPRLAGRRRPAPEPVRLPT